MNITSWWFQPSGKISVKMGIIPKIWVNITNILNQHLDIIVDTLKAGEHLTQNFVRSLNLRGNFEPVSLNYLISCPWLISWIWNTPNGFTPLKKILTKHHMVHPKQTGALSSQKFRCFAEFRWQIGRMIGEFSCNKSKKKGCHLSQICSLRWTGVCCDFLMISSPNKAGNQTQAPGIFVWSRSRSHSLFVLW